MKYIRILPSEPKCRPFNRDCDRKDSCARYLTRRDVPGEPDFTLEMTNYGMAGTLCHKFLGVKEAEAAANAKPVKPWPTYRAS